MKVLQVLLPVGMGGVESIANMLDQYLNNNSVDSYVAVGRSYFQQYLYKYSINKNAHYIYISDIDPIMSIIDIRRVINNINPDIIQTHARRECVYSCICSKRAILIRTQHMEENPSVKVSAFEKKLLSKKITRWIATSHTLKNVYLSELDYIDHNKIKVVYNGVEDLFDNTKDAKRKSFSFCLISRLTKQKGIDILISELCKFPGYILNSIHIDIWGEGPELDNIKSSIIANHLSTVISYRGTTDEPKALFNRYSALLMPSRYEGLPLTMLEAMSFKLPVATHDVGCCNEFISTNKNGWIIDSNYSWLNFFDNFLNMDETTYENIADNARITYEKEFSASSMCNSYLEVYKSLFE